MDIMNEIKDSLNTNPELSEAVKGNVYELVSIFHEKFPAVELLKLRNKLTSLKVLKLSKFVNKDISMYDFRKNIIYFNSSEMSKGYDMKHVLMFELLNIISSCEEHTGFNVDNKYVALNVGYTELLANYLVGNDSELFIYQGEAATVNLISILVGVDTFYESYFKNDFEILAAKLVETGVVVA